MPAIVRLVPVGQSVAVHSLVNVSPASCFVTSKRPRSTQQHVEWRAPSLRGSARLGLVVSFVVAALFVSGSVLYNAVDGDYESWQTGYLLLAAGGGLAVSSVLGALYIRGLTKSLNLAAASA